ncbi:MAG: hypothetical protein ACK4WC_00620 [Rubrimonas sp.]
MPAAVGASDAGAPVQPAPTGAILAAALIALAALAAYTALSTGLAPEGLAHLRADDAAAAETEIAVMTAAMTRIGERLSRRQIPAAPSRDTDAGDGGLAPHLTVHGGDGEGGRPLRRAEAVRDRAASAGETAVPPGAMDAGIVIG